MCMCMGATYVCRGSGLRRKETTMKGGGVTFLLYKRDETRRLDPDDDADEDDDDGHPYATFETSDLTGTDVQCAWWRLGGRDVAKGGQFKVAGVYVLAGLEGRRRREREDHAVLPFLGSSAWPIGFGTQAQRKWARKGAGCGCTHYTLGCVLERLSLELHTTH